MFDCMSERFRPGDLNKVLLLPPALRDWLPEKHLARFISDSISNFRRTHLQNISASLGHCDGCAGFRQLRIRISLNRREFPAINRLIGGRGRCAGRKALFFFQSGF